MTSSRATEAQSFPLQRGRFREVVFFLCIALLACVGGRASGFAPGQTTFAETPVGATTQAGIVVLTVQSTGTAGAPLALTEGVTTPSVAEFAVSDAGTCGANPSLSPGQSCTVAVTFTPRYPGVRHGAVVLMTSGGQLLASTLISGVGKGGLPVLIPGQIDTVAGNGQWFYQSDGVKATLAPIYLPSGLAVDGAGNLYLSDSINNRVRRVDAVTHIISTVAGNGSAGASGDGHAATAAQLANPSGLALDGAGNLFIADTGNNTIRRVDAVSGMITTVAGTPGVNGYQGDGFPAANAKLDAPQGLALTPAGDLLIADTSNAVIRVVTMGDGLIQTIAGTGSAGYNGDEILAVNAQLNSPSGVAVREDGAIAVADLSNNRVRLFMVGGTISTVAGTGALGYTGDGHAATQAALQGPAAVAFDPAGDLIIADSSNNCVRLVYGAQGTIMTLTGTPNDDGYAGDSGPEDQARMHGPVAVVFDAAGNLWVADHFNNRVREINGSLLTLGPYPTMKVGKVSQTYPEQMLNAGNQVLAVRAPGLQEAALDATTTTCSSSMLASASLCKMGVEFAPTEVGDSINGSITWTSDAPNVTPIDKLNGTVLDVEPTSVALKSNASPGLLGQSVMLTATVTSDDKGRTGSVNFVEGGTLWCQQVPLGADGSAKCSVPGLALGTHTFVANYSGDNNNAGSQSAGFLQTIKEQAALALAVSTSPAVVTSNVVLSVSAVDSTGTPTGTVVIYDGATALQTVTLDGDGKASWSTTAFAVGAHNLSVQYSGDTANVPGTSSVVALQIQRASTVTVLTSNTNHAPVGSGLTFTVNVVSNNGPLPTGNVQLMDGPNVLASMPVSHDGSAIFALSTLTPGDHALTAVYLGDTNTGNSSSVVFTQTVQQIGTVTTLGADVDPLQAGAAVHLAAIVEIAAGTSSDGPLTGTVTFSDAGTVLGKADVNASGQATIAVTSLRVGVHPIVATFGGNTNYAASASGTLSEAVQQTASVVGLSAVSTSILTGKAATFTAVVTSATGVPTGTLTFHDGAIVLGNSTLDANGKASLVTTRLSTGAHTVTATYSGDANYLPATSAGLVEMVSLAQPVLSLMAPSSVGVAGLVAQFSATLGTDGVAPTGTLSLLDGAAVIGSNSVTATGVFRFAVSSLSVGSHQLVAKYSGDGNNAPASSTAVVFTVQQAATSTVLTTGINPLMQGQPLTLKAAVRSDSPHPVNEVRFFDGEQALASVPLGEDGTAEFVATGLSLGPHALTAVFLGDTNHAGSVSPVLPELVVQSVSLAIGSSVNPSVSGQNVVLTGQLQGVPAPTGSLSFRDGNTLLATVPLSGAAASLTTGSLSVGTHQLSVTYNGDTHYAATTAALGQTVLNATTTTSLSVDATPGTYGKPVSFAAQVSSNGGIATGVVRFEEAGRIIGTAELDASGKAVFALATLLPGGHQIVATYLGDGKASLSSSAPLALAVKQTTSLAVASSVNPARTLSAVTLSATVTNAGAVPASGSVTFHDGATVLGSAALGSGGTAALRIPQMAAGTHTITASYEGDGANFGSEAPSLNEVVELRPTSTTVTGTSTDKTNPQQVTLIAVVRGDGSVPPSGMVTFSNGTVTLGVASVDATGVASITVIFNTTTQQIVASYAGDVSYSGSESAATPISAGKPAQFTLSLSSADITIVSHQRTTLTVVVSSVKGFTDNIALGCLGLPYAATCTFDRTQVKLNADGTETASLIVDTGNPLGAGTSTAAVRGQGRNLLLCFSPLGLLAFLLRGRGSRRRLPALLAFAFTVALAAGGLTGCGGLQMSGTPPGTYSFHVIGTGQGSNATESQAINLVVTP